MAVTINASTSAGLVQTADLSGQLALQANGVTVATASSSGFNLAPNATLNTANTFGMKNRIINGGMTIDQRNAGASVSISSVANTYTLDRWRANASGGGIFSIQRSTTAPAGFINSILATVTTVDSSVTSGDFYHIRQTIEGFNFADLGYGTANAKTVTVSFWVRSSLAGTYTVLLRNEAGNRGYLSTYSINSANTFEFKTITIAGDTTGTWATDNTGCAIVSFSLGCGDTQTTNTWLTTVNESATGQTQWISTNGATFYITGVQLEVGTQATSFDFRAYGTELALCQRYFTRTGFTYRGSAFNQAGVGYCMWLFKTTMRAAPTISFTGSYYTTIDATATDGVMVSANDTNYPTIGTGTTASAEL
jgi:hypothetical protein